MPTAAVSLAALLLPGCGTHASLGAGSPPAPGAAHSEAGVLLSASQSEAVLTEAAQEYSFPVRRHVPGTISLNFDPGLVQAQATLLSSEAAYEFSRTESARVSALGTANGIAQREMEQAVADRQSAAAAFEAAKDTLRGLGKGDAQIRRMLASQPTELPAGPHSQVKWVTAYLFEDDSPLFHRGQPVAVRVAAIPGRLFHGTVSEVYSAVDPNSHRVTLRAKIVDGTGELRPGMLADILIQIGSPMRSIGIPASAVVREGDGTMTVWTTIDRRRFEQRTVATGLREDGRVQILRGLRDGQLVVTDGAVFLDNMLHDPPGD